MRRFDSCYLHCGGLAQPSFVKNGFTILKCSDCNLYTLETDQDYDEFLEKYYREGYFMGKDEKFGYADYLSEEPMVRKNASHYLHKIRELQPAGKLLDVGCAAGFFMDEALSLGYDVTGIDTSEFITKLAPEHLQSKIQTVPLHLATFPASDFDIVIMFDLIEHLADPRNDLTQLATAVKSKGLLVVGTGDVGSFYAHVLGSHNHFFAPPHHYFFFSRKTMTELLKQAGFEVIKIESVGKWLTFPYIARVAKHFNLPFFDIFMNSRIMRRLFNNKWFYLYFGDNMVVYARKI
ncbi:MAG: class I SAM-dependent methyltransferase [bacterium]|nr:class I SAM-dependent methyltransferase [bacterium]